MTVRITAVLAAVGALAVGVVGYAAGTSQFRAPPPLVAAARAAEATPVPGAAKPAEFSDDQRSELEGIIRNYLIAHPEVIADAISELQRKRDAAAQAAQSKAIADFGRSDLRLPVPGRAR